MERIKFDNFYIFYKKPKRSVISYYLFWEVLIPIIFYGISIIIFLALINFITIPKAILVWLLCFIIGQFLLSVFVENHIDKHFKMYNFYKKIAFMTRDERAVLNYRNKTWYIDFNEKTEKLETFLENKIDKEIPFNKFKKYAIMVGDTIEIKEY